MEFTLILNNKTLFRDFWNSDFDSNSGLSLSLKTIRLGLESLNQGETRYRFCLDKLLGFKLQREKF